MPFRQALHVTKHDGCAKPLRELIDLLVDHLREVIPSRPDHEWLDQIGRLLFMLPTPRRGRSSGGGDTAGDPVEPTGHGGPTPDRSGLARQDQECRLKRILGVVFVTEYRAADAEHHRTVSLDQSLERHFAGLTWCGHESLE